MVFSLLSHLPNDSTSKYTNDSIVYSISTSMAQALAPIITSQDCSNRFQIGIFIAGILFNSPSVMHPYCKKNYLVIKIFA